MQFLHLDFCGVSSREELKTLNYLSNLKYVSLRGNPVAKCFDFLHVLSENVAHQYITLVFDQQLQVFVEKTLLVGCEHVFRMEEEGEVVKREDVRYRKQVQAYYKREKRINCL